MNDSRCWGTDMGIIDWEGNRESFPNNIGEVGSSGSAMVDYALVIIVVFFCYSAANQVAAVKCVYPPRGYIGL